MSILVLFVSMALGSPVQAQSWIEQSQDKILQEIKKIDADKKDFGIWVKRGSEVVELRSDKKMIPASLSKIPTALAFLENQNMSEKFKTWIYHTGKIENGVLKGDLYLKGGGDPTFVTESMWLMINELKRSDFSKIEGRIFVDESYFDSDYYSNGRQTRRVDRAYDAPVGALSFNWNSIAIYVRPGKSSGEPARVYTDPVLPNIKVRNKATTTSSKKTSLQVSRKIKGETIHIDVTGKISSSKDEKAFYKSITQPAMWTGKVFLEMLKQAGFEYKGEVQIQKTPELAKQLVEYDGWSMPRLLSALSKFSNNFVAEMMTKHLGKRGREPASISGGLTKISEYLVRQGWSPEQFTFVNPSGFTSKNRIRPDLLGGLLEKAKYTFMSAPEFMSSLPISGVDGTLKSRMKQTMKAKVRAKTGYLSGVVGLAGYMETRSGGEPITFVMIYNGPSKKDWDVRAMFDRLLWRIYQSS